MSDNYYYTQSNDTWPGWPNRVKTHRIQIGYKQRPYMGPKILPYNRSYSRFDNLQQLFPHNPAEPFDAVGNNCKSYMDNALSTSSAQYKAAHGKAWAKMVNSSKDPRAALGVSLAEGREAMVMMVDRVKKLGKAYQALRRGDLVQFLKITGQRAHGRHLNSKWVHPKDASALWLEYWLGWAPMIGDIYNCAAVLTKDHFHTMKLHGSGSTPLKGGAVSRGPSSNVEWSIEGKLLVRMGCEVQVTNPNAYLLNLMGLANPASIAWAVVPFSFVAGWFMNLQQVLDSYTDFVGLAIIAGSEYTTKYAHASGREFRWDYPSSPPVYWKGKIADWVGHSTVRATGMVRPQLRAWVPAGLSPSRGATAISLLVSIFTKG